MTADTLVALVEARPVGHGRWQAICPVHSDRSPSLAIRDGTDGRVLVKCWAGCSLASILAALGLSMRDLFNDAPADPEALAAARSERVAREAAEQAKAKVEHRANDIHRRLGLVTDMLGARLARMPDGWQADALAILFHRACHLRCEVESPLGTGAAVKLCGPARQVSPFLEASEEYSQACVVSTEAELLRYIGTGKVGLPSAVNTGAALALTAQSPAANGALRRTA